MGSKTYVQRILKQFEFMMGYLPPKKVTSPIEPRDHPELDTSKLLDEKAKRLYWSVLGMLQWAVTIGRMDIHTAVMTMGRFRAEPREGHLKRIERIYAFLRHYKSSLIKFRMEMPDYSKYHQIDYDWKYLYGDMQEEIPDNMLAPKGKPVRITAFCDANLYVP